jgi:hypothetical protein
MRKIIAMIALIVASEVGSEMKAQTEIEQISYSIDTFMQKKHPGYLKIDRFKVLDVRSEVNYIEELKDSARVNTAVFESEKHPSSVRVSGPFVTLKEYSNNHYGRKIRDFVVPIDNQDNSAKIVKGFITDVDSELSSDFNFDLYYFTVFEKDGGKYFILIQDYQNPTSLEGIKKSMLDICQDSY